MDIQLKEISVRELTEGYEDSQENGVRGYGGKLDIRPPFQREFIYKDHQRNAVIDTITKDFPLNVMYWAVRSDGESFEIIDGQQRSISICQYVCSEFSVYRRYFQDMKEAHIQYFHTLQDDEQEQILDYKLMVYFCSGTDSEKLQWFKTINIAGERLSDQELRNAVYSGSWVADAKRHFSKTGCPAYGMAGTYLRGYAIRQDYLETAIKWISDDEIEEYMAKHQRDPNANELWLYFQGLVNWIKATFPTYRKEMQGIDWGGLHRRCKDAPLDSQRLEEEIATLMQDDDVTSKKGIYCYVLTREEKHLNIRAFTDNQRREAYERQEGICAQCNKHFEINEMEADHITPWHEGGKTSADNCHMLCREDNRRKSGT